MYLVLWVTFIVLSLIIIALGLFKSEHTELALIGFVFLFLLSLNLEIGTIQYKMGENYTYTCLCCGYEQERQTGEPHPCDANNASLVITSTLDYYETWDGGGTLGHTVGYWLMIASVIGFIGVLLGIRAQRFN